jgi:N-acetylglucosamine kinase-like BadF-type ATPase
VQNLSVDGGRSKTVLLSNDGVEVRGEGLPFIGSRGGLDAIIARVVELRRRGGLADVPVDTVVVGLNGLTLPSPWSARLAKRLQEATGANRLCVTSDAVLSYVGALGLSEGAVVAAGTGAVGLGIGGSYAQVDGLGHLAGDRGSGYWIGVRGLRLAAAHTDGLDGSQVLLRAIDRQVDGIGPFLSRVYSLDDPVYEIATLTHAVNAAAGSGDLPAIKLLERAGRALARTVVQAARSAGLPRESVKLCGLGGVFRIEHPSLREAFVKHVEALLPGAEIISPTGNAAQGGLALATVKQRAWTRLGHWQIEDVSVPPAVEGALA